MIWGRTPGIFLNAEGKAEAQRLADEFKNVELAAIYSSPLERARETAEAIARVAKLEVKESLAFNEINFGEWTGQSLAALFRDERWHRFNTLRSTTRIPGGELFLEVQARTVLELERLSQHHAGGRVLIVSHADVIKSVLSYIGGTPVDEIQQMEIWPCSVSIVALDEHDARVLA
jgi:probable phosphoglycerate mutase